MGVERFRISFVSENNIFLVTPDLPEMDKPVLTLMNVQAILIPVQAVKPVSTTLEALPAVSLKLNIKIINLIIAEMTMIL